MTDEKEGEYGWTNNGGIVGDKKLMTPKERDTALEKILNEVKRDSKERSKPGDIARF